MLANKDHVTMPNSPLAIYVDRRFDIKDHPGHKLINRGGMKSRLGCMIYGGKANSMPG